ncbi:MAG TPA: DUF5597 domain-containing protein [Verrucomicrobiae bacterium]|nr:DUF5597 domain-containing protein [Verrucomicrobiae bacterium]
MTRTFAFFFLLLALGIASVTASATASAVESIPHLRKQGTATQLIVDGKPLLMLAGELHNSSTSGTDNMKPIWPHMAALNLNTVIAAVSWELVEPVEGKFDFALVDDMLEGARDNHLRLVLLWFGSWKNGASTYAPSWVKRDLKRYPRVQDEHGRNLEILSTFGTETRDSDARGFAALMRHLRKVDGQRHTVVMIQVENEVGVLNARRDFSESAEKAFSAPVPSALMDYLVSNRDRLVPELAEAWQTNGSRSSGNWETVFGKGTINKEDWKARSYYPEEIFMSWQYAQYVEHIAAAGKAEYPLPLYVNAWLKQPGYAWPGAYPSGGPLPQVMDIWRAGAPHIDLIAPDIYMQDFEWICELYHRSGNPLFIPETRGGAVGAARVFWAMGRLDAMGFSPFGIDSAGETNTAPLAQSYLALSELAPLLLEHQGMGTTAGVMVSKEMPNQNVTLGDYKIVAKLGRGADVAGALLIETGPDEFVVEGKGLDIFFEAKPNAALPLIGIDFVDELAAPDAKSSHSFAKASPAWPNLAVRRRLNGDEVHTSTFDGTGLKLFGSNVSIQRVRLYRYPAGRAQRGPTD